MNNQITIQKQKTKIKPLKNPRHRKYSYVQMERDLKKLVKQINDTNMEFENIFAIERGGLYIGLRLSHILGIPIIRNYGRIGKKTIIVDEIVDSGQSLEGYKNYFTVCIHWKPWSCFVPNIYLYETKDWIDYFWEAPLK